MLPIATHQVINTVPMLENYNVYEIDVALQECVPDLVPETELENIINYGVYAGSELIHKGFLANQFTPMLHQFDHAGNRVDWVEYHPAYHDIMARAVSYGLHSLPWETKTKGYGHRLRAVMMYLHNQIEAGTACPLSMTYAAMPVLEQLPQVIKSQIIPKLISRTYDGANRSYQSKSGITVGMSMTEKQGGSDVRANQTQAIPTEDGGYTLTGHKWFCSAPMSDLFLMTAATTEGISCFVVPRWITTEKQNNIYLQRLKNKLGNRSNASSEIELNQAIGYLVGAPGQGIKTIMDMVMLTRFDCMIGSMSIMRQALLQAFHHVRHRQAFGNKIVEYPLMRQVLADLQLEIEGQLAFCFNTAHYLDQSVTGSDFGLARLLTTVGKYWICKTAPLFVNEAQEALGGVGYIEDHMMPRLYREAPLNSIWEGCGHIQCLDLLRIIQKHPDLLENLLGQLSDLKVPIKNYDGFLIKSRQLIDNCQHDQIFVKELMYCLYTLITISTMVNRQHPLVEAYAATRMRANDNRFFGATTQAIPVDALVARIAVF